MHVRKVYNNDDIALFSMYQRLLSPRVIIGDRASTHYQTRAWQTLIHGKECLILLLFLPRLAIVVDVAVKKWSRVEKGYISSF